MNPTHPLPMDAINLGDYHACRDFFDEMWEMYCDDAFDCDVAESVRLVAQRLGLIREEKYTEETHGSDLSELWDYEEGDPIYFANKACFPQIVRGEDE